MGANVGGGSTGAMEGGGSGGCGGGRSTLPRLFGETGAKGGIAKSWDGGGSDGIDGSGAVGAVWWPTCGTGHISALPVPGVTGGGGHNSLFAVSGPPRACGWAASPLFAGCENGGGGIGDGDVPKKEDGADQGCGSCVCTGGRCHDVVGAGAGHPPGPSASSGFGGGHISWFGPAEELEGGEVPTKEVACVPAADAGAVGGLCPPWKSST